MVLRNAGRCSAAWRALPGRPLRDDDGAYSEVVQGIVDAFLAVAAVSGDGARPAAGALDDPLDGGGQLWGVGWVALVHAVVQDDTVVVVDDLALVAEFDRLAQASLGDRP